MKIAPLQYENRFSKPASKATVKAGFHTGEWLCPKRWWFFTKWHFQFIFSRVTHQPRRTTYFVLFILTINLCFACLILSVVGRGKLAGLPWLSLQGRWDHRGCNSEDKIGITSRPINTICRRVKSSTSKWHRHKENFLIRQEITIRAGEIGNCSNRSLPLSFLCSSFCASLWLNKPDKNCFRSVCFSNRTCRIGLHFSFISFVFNTLVVVLTSFW